jgi:hypothetical protein
MALVVAAAAAASEEFEVEVTPPEFIGCTRVLRV